MKLLFTIVILCIGLDIYASEQFEVETHNDVKEFIELKMKEYLASEILIVFDIDNTILATDSNFGSDQWFQWQKEQLENQTNHSIATNFTELLNIQNQIFAIGKMHLTEKILINFIPELQKKKITTIALTSRGPEMRNNTNKELQRNKISFNESPLGESIGSSFYPKESSRLASYQDGIFMTSGMHKGEMLNHLLNRFNRKFKCIIFIDDHLKHTSRVYKTFESTTDIYTFRYAHEDERVKAFKRSKKKQSIQLGKELLKLTRKL